MAGVGPEIADAVRDLIQAGFSTRFDPQREYDATEVLDASDSDVTRCHIVPAAEELSFASRVTLQNLVGVDVAIRRRFGNDDTDPATGRVKRSAIDDMVALLEDVIEYVAGKSRRGLAGHATAGFFGAQITVPWHPDHLQEERQYTGIARLTYRVDHDVS
jgi:hypothetical protein